VVKDISDSGIRTPVNSLEMLAYVLGVRSPIRAAKNGTIPSRKIVSHRIGLTGF